MCVCMCNDVIERWVGLGIVSGCHRLEGRVAGISHLWCATNDISTAKVEAKGCTHTDTHACINIDTQIHKRMRMR